MDIEATKSGAMDFLVKGWLDSTALERCIRYAVERGHVEAALRESEERFRRLVEHAGDDSRVVAVGIGQYLDFGSAIVNGNLVHNHQLQIAQHAEAHNFSTGKMVRPLIAVQVLHGWQTTVPSAAVSGKCRGFRLDSRSRV